MEVCYWFQSGRQQINYNDLHTSCLSGRNTGFRSGGINCICTVNISFRSQWLFILRRKDIIPKFIPQQYTIHWPEYLQSVQTYIVSKYKPVPSWLPAKQTSCQCSCEVPFQTADSSKGYAVASPLGRICGRQVTTRVKIREHIRISRTFSQSTLILRNKEPNLQSKFSSKIKRQHSIQNLDWQPQFNYKIKTSCRSSLLRNTMH